MTNSAWSIDGVPIGHHLRCVPTIDVDNSITWDCNEECTVGIRGEVGVDRTTVRKVSGDFRVRLDDAAQSHFSKIPTDLMIIKFAIGDKVFQENFRKVLYFGRSDISSMDYQEIDKTLDAMAEWQTTLVNSLGHIQYQIALVDRDIMDEKAEGYKQAETRVIERRINILGRCTSDMTRVSQDDRHLEFLRDPELSDQYRILIEKQAEYLKNETVLKGVIKILEQRITSMQGIAKRHYKEQKGYNQD